MVYFVYVDQKWIHDITQFLYILIQLQASHNDQLAINIIYKFLENNTFFIFLLINNTYPPTPQNTSVPVILQLFLYTKKYTKDNLPLFCYFYLLKEEYTVR